MKQKSEAIAAQHVVEIIEEPRKETQIKEKHHEIAATVLGVIQIICGIVALGVFIARIVVHDNTFSFDNSILISILFFVSGMLTLGRLYSENKWLLVASMVMAAASILVAAFLLVHAGLSHGVSCSFDPGYGNTSYTGNYSDFDNNSKYIDYEYEYEYGSQNNGSGKYSNHYDTQTDYDSEYDNLEDEYGNVEDEYSEYSEFMWQEHEYNNTDYADIWADYAYEDYSYPGNSSDSGKEYNNGNQSYNHRYIEDMVIVVLAWTMLIAGTVSALFTCFTHLRPSLQSKLLKSGRLAAKNNLN